jgi:hypothetical protein
LVTFGIRAAILEKPQFKTRLQIQVDDMAKQNEGFEKTLLEIQAAIGTMVVKQGETQEMLLKLDKSVAGWRPQVDAAVQGL